MNRSSSIPSPDTQRLAIFDKAGMMLIFAVLFIAGSIFIPNFFSWVNMNGLALSVATVGLISCTMVFCLAAGDFDLSVGSVVALAGVAAALTIQATNSVLFGIVVGILTGGIIGFINGIVIAVAGINALITTLATMQIARGLSYIISDGKAIGIRETGFFCARNFFLVGSADAGVDHDSRFHPVRCYPETNYFRSEQSCDRR